LGARIIEYLKRIDRKQDRIFSAEPKTAIQMFSAVVSDIEDGERITQGRVSRVIANEVMRASGDQSLAWCVSAELARRNEPRMFYTVYSAERLKEAYSEAVNELRSKIELRALSTLPVTGNDGYIGARFVVTGEAVINCICKLMQYLKIGLSHPDRIQERIDYHNHYTLYTWIFQALSSTLRAVNNPTEIISQRKQTNGVEAVNLADKEGIYRDRARLVFLGGKVQLQLDHYLHHRRILIDSIGIQNPVAMLKADACLLFSLTTDKKPLAVTKSWIEEQLEKLGFPFPGNFHRAYLRTELLQADCQPQVIDAFLGHTSQGESPFDAFSTFEYHDYKIMLASHLEKILKRLGLVPIWSRLIPH